MNRPILVIRFGSLGDLILTTPTLLNIKLSFPNLPLIFLTKLKFEPLVRCFDGVDEVITIPDECSTLTLYHRLLDLDKRHFEMIIDLHGNARSWLSRKLISADQKRVYFKRSRHRRQIARTQQIPLQWPHTIDLYNGVLEEIGKQVVCRRPNIQPVAIEMTEPPHNSAASSVVIAPGAAHQCKQWPIERFVSLAEELYRSEETRIIWATTSAEEMRGTPVPSIPGNKMTTLIDFPVEELAAVIRQADLTIANDSGAAHLSSSVGTPTLMIYGPTHPSLGFEPRGLFDRVVQVNEPCRPCSIHGKKPCWREEQYCFTRISVEDVYCQAREMIEECRHRSPVLFVDRDGTVMVNKHYLSDPTQVELEAGAALALKKARAAGYKIVVLSNQSGVARGMFSCESVEAVNSRFLETLQKEGAEIDGLYYCPHYPDGKLPEFSYECSCRKPKPGMVEEAAKALDIDIRKSVVIGDSLADVHLGRVIGGLSILVRTGHGFSEEKKLSRATFGPHLVCDSLLDAVNQLLVDPHDLA
jgi:histidinol-phosphate phosphatase family protein